MKIQDVSSLGRSTRLKGIKTSRQHEFLSDLERNYFYITEYSYFVIADELGIKHPTDPKTGEPIVMTKDFLLSVELENDKCKYLKYMSTILKNTVYSILYRSNLVMNRLFIL
nr:transposase [Bacillus pseudomycoides]